MGAYSTGVATKKRILDSCKKLFFEHGLNDTTYKMICTEADINRGLLPYHFKSKDNIAYCIYHEFLQDFESWIDEEFSETDFVIRFALSSIILYKCIYSNKSFMRFYSDIKSSQYLKPHILSIQVDTIMKISEASSLTIDETSIKTLSCMYYGVERELIYNSFHGYITENVEQISEKDLIFVLSMLNFDSNEIRNIIKQARNLSDNYYIEINDGFRYEFKQSISKL